jgi:hypothetical protein
VQLRAQILHHGLEALRDGLLVDLSIFQSVDGAEITVSSGV